MPQVSNTSFTATVSSNAMAVVDYLSKSMMSALPFIVCAALFRTVAVIMGATGISIIASRTQSIFTKGILQINRRTIITTPAITKFIKSCYC